VSGSAASRLRGFAAFTHRHRQSPPINFRSGATAVVCILIDELMIVAHCGDCRMLIHRNEKMYQITKVRDGQRACAQRLRAKRGGS
jgi:serine/threonine protein phosphatase PrpC